MFKDASPHLQKLSLQNSIIKLYEEMVVDNALQRDHYAVALAFLLLSTFLQEDFLPIYSLLSLNQYSESFSFTLYHDRSINQFKIGSYQISYRDSKNNFNQHFFSDLCIETNDQKRCLSDLFGNFVFAANDFKPEFSKYDNDNDNSPPCFITSKDAFHANDDGSLIITFTTKDIPGFDSWFFYLVIDQNLCISRKSSSFCFHFFLKTKMKQQQHTESSIFVRDEGPGAWGSSLTIPAKSWWMKYRTDMSGQEEMWEYTPDNYTCPVYDSHEIIEIFTLKATCWERETVSAYFS